MIKTTLGFAAKAEPSRQRKNNEWVMKFFEMRTGFFADFENFVWLDTSNVYDESFLTDKGTLTLLS